MWCKWHRNIFWSAAGNTTNVEVRAVVSQSPRGCPNPSTLLSPAPQAVSHIESPTEKPSWTNQRHFSRRRFFPLSHSSNSSEGSNSQIKTGSHCKSVFQKQFALLLFLPYLMFWQKMDKPFLLWSPFQFHKPICISNQLGLICSPMKYPTEWFHFGFESLEIHWMKY